MAANRLNFFSTNACLLFHSLCSLSLSAHVGKHASTHTPTHTHTYIHAYIHTYIHTYTHTHTLSLSLFILLSSIPHPASPLSAVAPLPFLLVLGGITPSLSMWGLLCCFGALFGHGKLLSFSLRLSSLLPLLFRYHGEPAVRAGVGGLATLFYFQ